MTGVVAGEPLSIPVEMRPQSVVELVHRSVQRVPNNEAVRWKAGGGWSSWTYAELWAQVAAVSMGLRQMGIGAGDRILVLSRSRPEFLVADLASMALGAVICPVYPGDPPARLATIAQRVGARLAFVEDAKLLQRLRSTPEGAGLDARIVLFEADLVGGTVTTLAGVAAEANRSPEALANWERTWRAINPAQLATIVHTMGVGGDPLGVVVSHANLVHSFEATVQVIPISAKDIFLSVLPMSHMFERGGTILVGLGSGATIAFADRKMDRWATDMTDVQPTIMAAIPLYFERIEHRIRTGLASGPRYRRGLFGWATGLGRRHYANHVAGQPDGAWLRLLRWIAERTVLAQLRGAFGGRLRFFISGGVALPERTGAFFESMGVTILEGYGLTETAPTLTVSRPGSYRYGTVGPPLPGTQLRLDPTSGEILARGPQVTLGYLDRPQETARALDAQGWLRTGDIGEFDEEDRLRITGRLKNLLVLATGKNVAPAPIERALEASPYIAHAVLLGDDRDATGVLLVPERGALPDGVEVAGLLRQEVDRLTAQFAAYERPRRFSLLPRPLTAEFGELDTAGSPVRALVMANFPMQVAELFERARRDQGPAGANSAVRAAASPDPAAESTVTASG